MVIVLIDSICGVMYLQHVNTLYQCHALLLFHTYEGH